MNLGKYQLVISVSVILASAIVALLFDHLKRNNERLREANTELKARRAKELKRLQRATAARTSNLQPEAVMMNATPAPLADAEQLPIVGVAEPSSILVSAFVSASSEAFVSAAEISNPPVSEVPAAELPIETAPIALSTNSAALSIDAAELVIVAAKEEPPVAVEQPAAPTGSRRNWGALLNSARPGTNQLTISLVEVPSIKPAAKPEVAFLPAGFHDESELRDLLAKNIRVTGLAVSIGSNVTEGPVLESVDELVKSLLQNQDFAAASAAGEFALIMQEETGVTAQRRLNSIAQQLWEFQIESLHEQPIALSWGGLEVRNQLLDEALAAAEERMLETKRNRKVLPMEVRDSRQEWRRRAV